MATGHDEEGADRLICGSAGSEGVSSVVGGDEEFHPNAWIGQGREPLASAYDFSVAVPVNAGDISVEWWYKGWWGQASPNGDANTQWVLAHPVTLDYGMRAPSTSGQRLRPGYRSVPWGGGLANDCAGAPILYPVGWHHYCANFDRVPGTLTAYQDALAGWALSTAVIDATNMGSPLLTIGTDPAAHMQGVDATPNDWNFGHNFGVWGPFAIHNRLLTVPEMQESTLNRTVQNIAAVTLACYHWDQPIGVTGWDFDVTHMAQGMYYQPWLRGMPIGAPTGTTVTEYDKSGNTRHYPINVSAIYGVNNFTETLPRARCLYAMDPFFRRGGGRTFYAGV